MIRKIKRYGWKRSISDPRDIKYAVPRRVSRALPPSADLRAKMPLVYDQGDLGSCTANAIGGACQYADKINGVDEVIQPSRLFIYYNERVMEGTVNSDDGAEIRDGMKAINTWGYPSELVTPNWPAANIWTYNVDAFAKRPSDAVYKAALVSKIDQYAAVTQIDTDIKGCLADGFPVIFGFVVFPSFESAKVAKTGAVPMPKRGEPPIGGHAVMLVGYDDKKKIYIVRNSWGKDWGLAGYFTMPYSYVQDHNLASDFWMVRFAP